MKKAVLLINLGSPNKPTIPSVWKYLRQFLMDPRVIDIPYLIRWFLVNCIIIPKRVANSTAEYKKLWAMFGESPLVKFTKTLRVKLQKQYGSDFDFYDAMRYQNPSIDHALAEIQSKNYAEVIILPLYPQYASASTGSTIEYCQNIMKNWWNTPTVKVINHFCNHPAFIQCFVDNTKKMNYKKFDHILFSYHGLPERHVDKSHVDGSTCKDKNCTDGLHKENTACYRAMCYETTKRIVEKLNVPTEKYTVSFQSRLNDDWIKPYTDIVMVELAKTARTKVLVLSPAFVSDCLETSIEISERNQKIFIESGGTEITLVPSLNDNDDWVDAVMEIIKSHG